MTQQEMPNPIDLYSAAIKGTRQIIGGVQSSQLGDSTPCSEWNVQALMDHLIGGTGMIWGSLAGAAPETPQGNSPGAAFDAGTAKVLDAAKAPGALEKTVPSPLGDMPGGQLLGAFFMDTLIHGWDLATATGQSTEMPADLAETCFAMFGPMADEIRKSGAFGPRVEVADDASTQVKLLGALGRKAWTDCRRQTRPGASLP